MMNQVLIVVALVNSAALFAVGRRLPRPASIAAYTTALAVLIAVPLFPEATVQRVDRLLGVGVGRLLVHIAFMMVLGGLVVTVVLATHRWTRRHRYAVGGMGLMMAFFLVCWLAVRALNRLDLTVVFYGHWPRPPTSVLWMNIARGSGIVYIVVWGLSEYFQLLRGARRPYERGFARLSIGLYVLAGVAGTLTIVESIARHCGLDMAVMQQVRIAFTAGLITTTAVVLVGQIWLASLWRSVRQLLLRYVASDLRQLREDILNLSALEAERHLDIQYEAYAHRAIVEAVLVRCRAAGVSSARRAMARMAVILLTVQREHLLEDPSYGLVTSWAELMTEAAEEMNQNIAATAWEQALHGAYVYQHVYILIFLILDSKAYRETLLVHASPRVQTWHSQLADLIAMVMHEHGYSTARAVALAHASSQGNRLARRGVCLVSRWGRAVPGLSRFFRVVAERPGEERPTK